MALFDTLTPQQKKKPKYFGAPDDPNADLFSGLPTGEEDNPTQALVGKTLQDTLSGAGYDASRTQSREALARAASNLRSQTGGMVAEGGFLGQGTANKSQQGVEQSIFQGLADEEMTSNVEEQAMKERGLGLAADIGAQQQNIATQRRGQDISLLQSREQTAAQKDIASMNITSAEKMAANSLGLDAAKLAESARQFNVSSEQAAKNAADMLKFNYDELDISQKQFLASLGLDREKFETSKMQFQQQLEQQGRLTMAELSVQEKQIAEGARQFDNRLDFDRSELAANLSEAEKNRVWQAIQNDKTAENALTIATMQNDTERWKTDQTAILTRAGWDVQSAENLLDRRLQETMQNKDIALQREIESGRLSEAEAARVQQAEQFTDQLEWEKEATRLGLSADEAARAWQTKERVASQAFTATEASLNRQLEREIEEGRLTVQEQQLAQQASQFTDQLDWQKTAKELDLSDADTQRIWEASEAAKDRVFQADLQQIQNEFTARGWSYTAFSQMLDTLPEEQVADYMRDAALRAGIEHQATDSAGEPVIDSNGDPVMVPGLKSYSTPGAEGYAGWTPGSTVENQAQYNNLLKNMDSLAKEGKAVTDNGVEGMNIVNWTTSGWNRWAISDDAKNWASKNAGKPYLASNGRVYEIVGYSNPKDRLSMGAILFKDISTGAEVRLTRDSGFPEV